MPLMTSGLEMKLVYSTKKILVREYIIKEKVKKKV